MWICSAATITAAAGTTGVWCMYHDQRFLLCFMHFTDVENFFVIYNDHGSEQNIYTTAPLHVVPRDRESSEVTPHFSPLPAV